MNRLIKIFILITLSLVIGTSIGNAQAKEFKMNNCYLNYLQQKYIVKIEENFVEISTLKGKKVDRYLVPKNKKIISANIYDIDNIKEDRILLIEADKKEKFGKQVIILSFNGRIKSYLEHTFQNLNIWKVTAGDIEGDGKKEISFGVYKSTRFHPELEKRPFIYSWNGKGISPKWLGSCLSRPFEDYIFLDIDSDGMDEIVSLEKEKGNTNLISCYKWNCFGFKPIGESKKYENISEIRKGGSNVLVKIRTQENKWIWVELIYKDKKLIQK